MNKSLLLFALLLTSCGALPRYTPAPVMAAGITPVATNTATIAAPTPTPFPTIDYRATDQAYQLQMEQQRNDMIKAQLAHDEEMMKQQVLLASINATATYAGTQVAMQQTQDVIAIGKQTLEAGQMTATAQAPMMIVSLANSENKVKHMQTDYIINMIGVGSVAGLCIVLVWFLIWKMRTFATIPPPNNTEYQTPIVPEGFTPYIREDHGGGDFTKWFVPCTEEQMTEIWELVVNGERNFAINRLETNTRTLKRPTLTKLRKWFRANEFATELGAGEIALNDRAVAFIEKWG